MGEQRPGLWGTEARGTEKGVRVWLCQALYPQPLFTGVPRGESPTRSLRAILGHLPYCPCPTRQGLPYPPLATPSSSPFSEATTPPPLFSGDHALFSVSILLLGVCHSLPCSFSLSFSLCLSLTLSLFAPLSGSPLSFPAPSVARHWDQTL